MDPVEGAADRSGEDLGEQRLADAGDVLDQQVASAEQGGDAHFDDLVLAGDDGIHRADQSRGEVGDRVEFPLDDRRHRWAGRDGTGAIDGGGNVSTQEHRSIQTSS